MRLRLEPQLSQTLAGYLSRKTKKLLRHLDHGHLTRSLNERLSGHIQYCRPLSDHRRHSRAESLCYLADRREGGHMPTV